MTPEVSGVGVYVRAGEFTRASYIDFNKISP